MFYLLIFTAVQLLCWPCP